MKKLFILTFILFIIFSNLSYASFCTGTQPPSNGDWIIEDNTQCVCSTNACYAAELADIKINGSVTVKGNGNLSIKNCLLYVRGNPITPVREKNLYWHEIDGIIVKNNGNLTIEGGALRVTYMSINNIMSHDSSSINLINTEWCQSHQIISQGQSKSYFYGINNFYGISLDQLLLFDNSDSRIEKSSISCLYFNPGITYGTGSDNSKISIKDSSLYSSSGTSRCFSYTTPSFQIQNTNVSGEFKKFNLPLVSGANENIIAYLKALNFPLNLPVSIREGSCSGQEKFLCNLSAPGNHFYNFCDFNFAAPSIPGVYTYYTCIDKNTDGIFDYSLNESIQVINLNQDEIAYCSELNEKGKTYKLITDIKDTRKLYCMRINADDIVLDCQGHTIDKDIELQEYGYFPAIYAENRKNVTIKNCILSDWGQGISFRKTNQSLIQNNTILKTLGFGASIILSESNENFIDGNTIGVYEESSGIEFAKSTKSTNNIIKNNKLHTLSDKTFRGSGIYFYSYGYVSTDNKFYFNLFNCTQNFRFYDYGVTSGYQNYWNSTEGGNYWTNSTNNGFSNTCSDNNGDRICDSPYTLASNNIDFMPLKYIPDDYSSSGQITLQSGWNMLSLPFSTDANIIKTQCGTTNNIWHYNPSTARYVSVNTIYPGYGYWLRLDSPCVISYSSITENYPELKAGWNQIGAFTSTSFSSVKGDCNVLAGPWKYNPSTSRYELSSTLEPGYGYWIRVSNDCSLGI